MGSAIAECINLDYKVSVFDKDANKTQALSGIEVTKSVLELVKNNDVVMLAVKPQDLDGVLNETKGILKDKLVISIAAGVTTTHIEKLLGNAGVIRVMPNLPVKIKEGMTCLCKGIFASEQDLKFAEGVFNKVGKTLIINENMMPAATAVSGSGPGFFCDLVEGKSLDQIKYFSEQYFIPALISTATNLAFTPIQAKILAETTGVGVVNYLIKEGLTPGVVKKQVASPGGTTEAGLNVLHHDIKNLDAAIQAAKKRAEELSKKE